MHEFQSVLLNVWREACRHIDISESVIQIAPLLVSDMPLGQMIICRYSAERGMMVPIAYGWPEGRNRADMFIDCSSDGFGAMREDFLKQKVYGMSSGKLAEGLRPCVPGNMLDRDILVGVLEYSEESISVLVLIADENKLFDSRHGNLAEVLLDPLAVALQNSNHLQELSALRRSVEAENFALLRRLGKKDLGDRVIGEHAGLADVMGRVRLVAASGVPVLLFGETGSGKEVIAREIHKHSARSEQAFVRVNCGAIPSELIDSQLFGHEQGAFTGAVKLRNGWFERADGGTLLLDEVAELPLEAQVRLLRVLQDGWIERVGGREQIHVDVRIVAATHRDLPQMVADGKFREDLWYRLAVFPVIVPPLRKRCEDIRALAIHFAERAAMRFGLALVMPSEDDIRVLCEYKWPGNVRELSSVIDRAALLGEGKCLEVAKALGITGSLVVGMEQGVGDNVDLVSASQIASLDDIVRQQIVKALISTRGKVDGLGGCAEILKVNPNTLRARMRKLNIDWRRYRAG